MAAFSYLTLTVGEGLEHCYVHAYGELAHFAASLEAGAHVAVEGVRHEGTFPYLLAETITDLDREAMLARDPGRRASPLPPGRARLRL
jgi:hypothetical protein